MLKDTRSQKQKFMDELGHQLQCRKLDTQQMNDGLLHVKWNEQKLCTVDSSGAVRFRAGDILDAEAEHQLQSVMHMAKQVKEYMQILELAPSICVHGPDDRRKVFADFGDVVLVGSAGRKIVDFATWEWDYGRALFMPDISFRTTTRPRNRISPCGRVSSTDSAFFPTSSSV